MGHLVILFSSVGILTLIPGFVASIIIGQMSVGNITVITIQKCRPTGYHLCEENMPHVYTVNEQ